MIKAGAIAKGTCLLINGAPFSVIDREFVNPGKGSAFVRLKMKNLQTGQILKQTIKTQESVEEIEVEERGCQFMYADGENYHFMDNLNFEQYAVAIEGIEDTQHFLKEGENYKVVVWEERPIDIILPMKLTLEVTEANEGLKGDTVTGATKPVTLETGLVVRVPLFIKQGEFITVNTDTKDYVERVNK